MKPPMISPTAITKRLKRLRSTSLERRALWAPAALGPGYPSLAIATRKGRKPIRGPESSGVRRGHADVGKSRHYVGSSGMRFRRSAGMHDPRAHLIPLAVMHVDCERQTAQGRLLQIAEVLVECGLLDRRDLVAA
jgi:hypothetical protein